MLGGPPEQRWNENTSGFIGMGQLPGTSSPYLVFPILTGRFMLSLPPECRTDELIDHTSLRRQRTRGQEIGQRLLSLSDQKPDDTAIHVFTECLFLRQQRVVVR